MKAEKIDEKSCGAVLYQKRNNVRYYLIVESASGHVSFPKGHIESGETEWETACREIFEETGIQKMDKKGDFRESFVCMTEKGKRKEIVYFLAEFEEKTIILQDGELVSSQMLPLEEACAIINTQEEREILRKAEEYLEKNE